ncbi:hypothetical protein, partial [Paraburkholderia sp. BR14320]|uniref:hypothetical protein n=1 Tax=unclassified Paraburkholderia TaxID=2615204 RepID=UPI0034CFF576
MEQLRQGRLRQKALVASATNCGPTLLNKAGRDAGQTPWRKMHLSIDPQMNVHHIAITGDNVSDEAGLNAVL